MILVIDDDRSVTASLALLLKQAGHGSRAAASPEEALAILRAEPCKLVVQDMNFSRRTSGEEGLELLTSIKAAHPQIPVVLITAWGSIPLAVEGMKRGAADFVTKPWTNQHLLQTIETTLGVTAARPRLDDTPPTREELDGKYDFGELIGTDPRILRLLNLIGRIAATDASVLITGESGTGKELVADAILRNSRRHARPFIRATGFLLHDRGKRHELFRRVDWQPRSPPRPDLFDSALVNTLHLVEHLLSCCPARELVGVRH